ncbi:MAG: DUF885 domain-containing protein, partial [Pricia sp.]
MKYKILIAALVLTTLACKNEPKNSGDAVTTENQAFDSLTGSYYQEGLQINPLSATFQGDERYNDTLPNFLSDKYEKRLREYYS